MSSVLSYKICFAEIHISLDFYFMTTMNLRIQIFGVMKFYIVAI